MLTKGDLAAIQKMFDILKKDFSDKLQKNTEDLVDLITVGFNRTENAIKRLNEHDEIINDHEHRLNKIENKIFV